MAKNPRRPTPNVVELQVLDASRRRCALCFHFNGDLAEKLGQIAHLDDDPSNSDEDNLAFLCLEHHSLYDSRTKQHKNYTLAEAKKARDDLYEAIKADRHIAATAIQTRGREADRQVLAEIMTLLSGDTIHFLRNADLGFSFPWSRTEPLGEIARRGRGAEHEFIDPELEALRQIVVMNANEFGAMLATNTWPVDGNVGWNSVPKEWEFEQPERHERVVRELNASANRFCGAYDSLVRTARRKLML